MVLVIPCCPGKVAKESNWPLQVDSRNSTYSVTFCFSPYPANRTCFPQRISSSHRWAHRSFVLSELYPDTLPNTRYCLFNFNTSFSQHNSLCIWSTSKTIILHGCVQMAFWYCSLCHFCSILWLENSLVSLEIQTLTHLAGTVSLAETIRAESAKYSN